MQRTPPHSMAGIQPLSQNSSDKLFRNALDDDSNQGSQTNESAEDMATLEEYNRNIQFIDEILIEGQKITKNKIALIKEKLLKWLVNQSKIEGKLEFAEKENERLRKQLEDKPKQLTYAQLVQKPTPPVNAKVKQIEENKDRSMFTIFIKGKQGESAKQIQQELTKKIDPLKEKINVTAMRMTEKAVIIETENEDGAQKIMNNKELADKFNCKRQRKNRLLVILYNVPSNITFEELSETIYVQNFEERMNKNEFEESFKPRFKAGPRDRPSVHVVAEVSPKLRKDIIEKRRLYSNFQAIAVKDYLTVPRCSTCQDLGHISKYCSKSTTICSHCGKENHTKKECSQQNLPPICIPCTLRKKSCKAKEQRTVPRTSC